ncbi:MAG TPA: ABC transporter ATP-binding protein [Casimicrobiaceae bacterium]|nr:ABC transporter ATP-binding protein [Casimicrobiaceae bacterium]
MKGAGEVRLQGVVKRHGAFTALHGVDLDIHSGEFFALLGPSGSGKTTTLRILAGLEPHDAGKVFLDGVDVTSKEPGERDVAMVFQSYALYPHMSVAENIGFPLRMIGTSRDETARAVRDAAARVHIEHLLDRKPGQLSGGQQQRCALARAIVRKPRLFLLDEPLSNLDAKLRLETRVELRKLQRALGVTTVYVTHDQEEAMTIADRMAVFIEGRIVQVGTPAEVFAHPANVTVAAFIGSPAMNLIPAQFDRGTLTVAGVALPFSRRGVPDGPITLGVRPSALQLGESGIPAKVYLIENLGESSIVDLHVGEEIVKMRVDGRPAVHEGEDVHLAFRPEGRICSIASPASACPERASGCPWRAYKQARGGLRACERCATVTVSSATPPGGLHGCATQGPDREAHRASALSRRRRDHLLHHQCRSDRQLRSLPANLARRRRTAAAFPRMGRGLLHARGLPRSDGRWPDAHRVAR